MNLQKLLKEAQKAQKKAAEVQEHLERMTVVGTAQGLVEVEANGNGKILALRLKPEVLKAFQDDLEGLEDLLLVAIQDAQKKAHELWEKEMARELGGVGDMLGKLL
jgi:DNA-binding YbaB/EbfC family protein